MSAATAPAPITFSAERKDDVPKGILAMIGASLFLAMSNAFAKYQVGLHPVGEIMFTRSIFSFLICSAFMLPRTGLSVYKTQRPSDHIGRGLSQAVSQTFTVLALSLMPLAGATAISFSAPLWSALISIVWLKERPGPMRWGFLLIGFVGVLIVAHPGANSLQLGALFALANAVMYGGVIVAVRGMAKTESANTLLMWQLLCLAVFHSFLLLFGVNKLSLYDASMLFACAACNVAGQWLWTRALKLGPATAVSPFYYTMMVWAMIIGFFAWGDVPTMGLVVGSSIVVVSGLLLLWNEAKNRGRAQTAPDDSASEQKKDLLRRAS